MPVTVDDSILATIKKMLGFDDGYTAFDLDIRININSVFSTLFQLGIGPQDKGFFIVDRENTWSEFYDELDDAHLNDIKTYIYQRLRLIFDPPATSFAIENIKAQTKETEWRLAEYSPAPLLNPTNS